MWENREIRGSKGLVSMVGCVLHLIGAVCPTFILICFLTLLLREGLSVLCVRLHVWVWGLSASNWTGTQLGSCNTATGETGGSEIKCQQVEWDQGSETHVSKCKTT